MRGVNVCVQRVLEQRGNGNDEEEEEEEGQVHNEVRKKQ